MPQIIKEIRVKLTANCVKSINVLVSAILYAAHGLKLWNIQATNALSNPPVKVVEVDGITLQIDQRNLKNSGATNYLTNDPYLL